MIRKLALSVLTVLVAATAAPSAASAQDTVDIGVIKQSDMRVVQKLLYPKSGRTEMTTAVGWMPFDAYVTTPNAQLAFTKHTSEQLGLGAMLGVGYGLKTGTYKELESPTYGVAPDAYRYLGSLLLGAEYTPVYGKMNLAQAKIVHYDVYGAGRVGASFEQSVIPLGGYAVAPTLSLGVGSRFFLPKNGAIRVEVRDDMLVEHRKLTQDTHFKQNVDVTIGWSILSAKKGK